MRESLCDLREAVMVFKCSFRARWVDTDVARVMHFTNSLRYFEACEEEYYRSLGQGLNALRENYGIILPRVEVHCRYAAPCRFDDTIEVTLKTREVADKTITYDFQLFMKEEEWLAAEGYVKCIAVELNWKAVPLPVEVAKAIHEGA